MYFNIRNLLSKEISDFNLNLILSIYDKILA